MVCLCAPKNTAFFHPTGQQSRPAPCGVQGFPGETLSLAMRNAQAYKQMFIIQDNLEREERSVGTQRETHPALGAEQGP